MKQTTVFHESIKHGHSVQRVSFAGNGHHKCTKENIHQKYSCFKCSLATVKF